MRQAQEFAHRTGKTLRLQNDDILKQPLPERWVELIHHLNEKERREAQASDGEQRWTDPSAELSRVCETD